MNAVAESQQAIDALDDQLIKLLVQRFKHAQDIGAAKRLAGLPPFDTSRMHSQIERFSQRCGDLGVNATMGKQLITIIVAQTLAERLAGTELTS